MTSAPRKIQWIAAIALLTARAFLAGGTLGAKGQEVGVEVKPVRVEKLTNTPGKALTVVTVTYAPGGKSGAHQHAGRVRAYGSRARSAQRTPRPDRSRSKGR